VSTQFFERQEVQKSYTRWLVSAFILAFLGVTLVIDLVIAIGLVGDPLRALRQHPAILVWTSLVVIGTMLVASWHKGSQLRAGGAVIARSLGGVPVTAQDSDLQRKRLLNVVEEMAIAARIRRPQVYVLPEERGINAFAAGHSPDEAAVAVTQGALDKLDREQLQAVIGHEFSHILNGDMRINMRLTAWIFGLFVITDLAMRIMRGRGGGKAGRIKILAFGVFLAGSVGLLAGRLIQAAVSRRREHLADASAVQFTRNPGALQGAFITMAATAEGSQLQHPDSVNVAHMLFANTTPSWGDKIRTAWFSTHPPLDERVRALDSRISPVKFRSLVSDERRKLAARAAQAGAPPSSSESNSGTPMPVADSPEPTTLSLDEMPLAMATSPQPQPQSRPVAAPADTPPSERSMTVSRLALEETLPSGVRMIAGRALPPDVLRNRLTPQQQSSVTEYLGQVEKSSVAVVATFVAAMLAAEPAKWRTQLTKLAPLLGIELMKETQVQVTRIASLAPAARLPLISDLLHALDGIDPADRKKLRAVARAFASTVATGDMLRFAVTRMLERRLAKAVEQPPPVPLPDRAPSVCEVYAALAQCRFGADKQGMNAYRAGIMGLLTPQKWSPFPDELLTPAQLDAALAALAQVHPTGKRSFSEGMARVLAVGGKLTVPQVELLRAACMLVDCPLPDLPADLVFDEHAPAAMPTSPAVTPAQANAR
jgi:Zn-dependent protease with chaperone function